MHGLIPSSHLDSPEVVHKVMETTRNIPYRPDQEAPDAPEDTHVDLVALMKKCWEEKPESRPSISDIKSEMKKINKGK